MSWGRPDPGDCLICGAAHCACGGGPILVQQLPASAAAAELARVPLVAEVIQATLPAGHVTSATYRGEGKRKR